MKARKASCNNPFQYNDCWFWTDDREKCHGPYMSQTEALLALLRFMSPPWHKRMWRKIWRTT
jgi:hypothetical protein